jgi:hypothetical protein
MAVNIREKFGVDPEPRIKLEFPNVKIFQETSDEFFSKNSETFDLIFLDGLHTYEQTWRDLQNSFASCKSNGIIVVDDVVPSDKFSAMKDPLEAYRTREAAGIVNTGDWSGDVFRVVLKLKSLDFAEIEFVTVYDLTTPALVIRTKKNCTWPLLPSINLSQETEMDFDSVFGGVVPEFFHPLRLDELPTWLME